MKAQQLGGLPYLPKCRDPRCSHECHRNWAWKQSACISQHLHDLPTDLKTYRGNLTLRKNATAEEHRQVKKLFNQTLRRWSKKNGFAVEFHATIHPTDPHNAHYDFVLYSNAPAKPLKETLSDSWSLAGGKRCSLVYLSGEEITSRTKYVVKTKPKEVCVVNREKRYLMQGVSECGVRIPWVTGGFWRGSSLDAVWKELVAKWFGDDEDDEDDEITTDGSCPITKRGCSVKQAGKISRKLRNSRDLMLATLDREIVASQEQSRREFEAHPSMTEHAFRIAGANRHEQYLRSRSRVQRETQEALASLPQPQPEPPPYIPGIDTNLDTTYFHQRLPTDPSQAVPLSTYSVQWGVDEEYMKNILTHCPRTTCVAASWHR